MRSRTSKLLPLVTRYFQAWRDQDVEALAEVFAPDAVYEDKAFREPLRERLGQLREPYESSAAARRRPTDPRSL